MASTNDTPPDINTNTTNTRTTRTETNTSAEYIDTPAKFDITTFPNASQIKIDTNTKRVKKNMLPNQPFRPLDNIPQQMVVIPDDMQIQICAEIVEEIKSLEYNYLNPSNRHKILRYIATSVAILAAILLLIAIWIDNTANGEYCIEGNCGTYECNWTGMLFNDGNNSSKYKTQYGGALICLCCICFAILFIIIGVIYVQPYKIQKRVCVPIQFARIFFVIAFILLLISIIVFVFGDTVCYANTSIDIHFELGPSIILDILGICIVFCILFIAL